MVIVTQKRIATIPSLLVVKQSKQKIALPTVVYFHGFTSAKEHNLPLAYLLAESGFRVILPDSLYHGSREIGETELKMELSFWDIVIQNVNELAQIRQHLLDQKLLLNDEIGVAGTSMGGITTSAALTQYPWIKAAAILMGSPKLNEFANELVNTFEQMTNQKIDENKIKSVTHELEKIDLSQQIDVLNERPLFIWHGKDDQVVPHNHAEAFYQEAKQSYKNEKLIQFSSESDRDHKVSRSAILQTVRWFKQHLNSNN